MFFVCVRRVESRVTDAKPGSPPPQARLEVVSASELEQALRAAQEASASLRHAREHARRQLVENQLRVREAAAERQATGVVGSPRRALTARGGSIPRRSEEPREEEARPRGWLAALLG